MKILLVEDDVDLAGALRRVLVKRGFSVEACGDGLEALVLLRHQVFDAVLLDLSIPGVDGLRLLQRIRENGDTVPVMILTARGAVGDRVVGLNAGADDYLAKPFDLDELEARLHAIVRRKGDQHEIRCGRLRLDRSTGAVFRDQRLLDLSPRESALLRVLMAKPGHAVTKERLHALVFSEGEAVNTEAVEVIVHRVRRKITDTGVEIMTLRGVGYLLCDAPEEGVVGNAP